MAPTAEAIEGAGDGPLDGKVVGVAAPDGPSPDEGGHDPLPEVERLGLIEGTGEEVIDCCDEC